MDDLISRQAAIDAIEPTLKSILQGNSFKAINVMDKIRELPSAQTERKRGKWIKTISENGITSAVRCSECGFEDNRYMLFRYCPHCGADMRGEQDEQENNISG